MTALAGCLSLPEKNLRTMLADSATFRTWVSAANQAAALAHIYLGGLPNPADDAVSHTLAELQGYRPYAVIYTAEESGLTRSRDSESGFDQSGQIVMRVEQDAPGALSDEPTSDANVQFRNTLGQIIDDLCGLANYDSVGSEGYLAFDEIALLRWGWGHPDDAPALGVYQGAYLGIKY